ncbi:hypothetical protein GIB67_032092, partial [Kingdonia uniflora]
FFHFCTCCVLERESSEYHILSLITANFHLTRCKSEHKLILSETMAHNYLKRRSFF